ncbi:MAG: AAA family ATPase [Cytophagales bacterium]|nr:AAA family ATPase [Cytophagales bacterium]
MYIYKIELENIRCFEKLTIDFEYDGKIQMWQTVLGNNAVGKSTILKCIAMGLCDESSAAALMKEENGEFIRKPYLKGSIEITLKDSPGDKGLTVVTNLTKETKESPEKLRQVTPSDLSLWKDIFMCGYGVQIGDGGGDTWENYKPLEAVYTLFNTGSDLQNTEAVMFKQSPELRDWLSEVLLKILMLDNYPKIEYNSKGMFVSGPWGKLRVGELSDGYRRVIQITVDFFGWQVVADKLSSVNDEIAGILLIDELETHLHPKWQRFIVDRFTTYLPKVQIITSTHSPLVALGTTDLEDALILELDLINENSNRVRDKSVDSNTYKGYTVDQILTSTAFDMQIARSGISGNKMIEFRKLFLIESKNAEEEKRFQELRDELESEIPEYGELEEDRKRQRELRQLIEELNNKLKSSND